MSVTLTDDNTGGVNPAWTTTTQTFTITVQPNQAPDFFVDGLTQAALNSEEQMLTLAGSPGAQMLNLVNVSAGPDESQVLSFSATSSNPALIPNPTTTYTSPNNAGTLNFTPASGASGSAILTLTLQDNGGTAGGGVNTTARTIRVAVGLPANNVPSFTIGANRTQPIGTIAALSYSNGATNLNDGNPEVVQAFTFYVTNDNAALFTTPPALSANGTLTYTPSGLAGTATVTATLTDDASTGGPAQTSDPQTFTITTLATTAFQTWKFTQLGDINAPDLGDPDADGLANLVEYAFGLNPTLADNSAMPQPQLSGGNFFYIFTGVPGVTYGAEWTTDLTDWTSVPDTGIAPQHIFSIPTGPEPKKFMRLKVTSP